jgi:protein-S-isoprenylcysteine O-methyltransferase Ste14
MEKTCRMSQSMDRSPRPRWWQGSRGEWYVAAQLVLFALVAFGPRRMPWAAAGRAGADGTVDSASWPAPYGQIASVAGAVLFIVGALLVLAGAAKLGMNLTPLPYPRAQATLRETGPFRLVRHPMYGGGILVALGWGLWVHGWLTLIYAAALFVLFDLKARREERWLSEKFSGYAAYQKRVKKLLPFVY